MYEPLGEPWKTPAAQSEGSPRGRLSISRLLVERTDDFRLSLLWTAELYLGRALVPSDGSPAEIITRLNLQRFFDADGLYAPGCEARVVHVPNHHDRIPGRSCIRSSTDDHAVTASAVDEVSCEATGRNPLPAPSAIESGLVVCAMMVFCAHCYTAGHTTSQAYFFDRRPVETAGDRVIGGALREDSIAHRC